MRRISASQSLPNDAPLPIAAGQALCSENSFPTQQCEDVPLIALFHPPKPRGIQEAVLHLTQDGSRSQLKR